MSEHTRGPWTYIPGTKGTQPKRVEGKPFHGTFAQISVRPDGKISNGMSFIIHTQNSDADARLIAAAPELLEALKDVLRVADRKTVEFDAARAAIAKARGAA